MEKRYKEVMHLTARLIIDGYITFSPVVHCHEMANVYYLPSDWEFWANYCLFFLEHSSHLVVLELDGWETSVGVAQEVAVAQQLDIPITYIKHSDGLLPSSLINAA